MEQSVNPTLTHFCLLPPTPKVCQLPELWDIGDQSLINVHRPVSLHGGANLLVQKQRSALPCSLAVLCTYTDNAPSLIFSYLHITELETDFQRRADIHCSISLSVAAEQQLQRWKCNMHFVTWGKKEKSLYGEAKAAVELPTSCLCNMSICFFQFFEWVRIEMRWIVHW